MFVVTRLVMAAGMGTYALIHALEALGGAAVGPWRVPSLALSAGVALVLAALLATTRLEVVEHVAAAVAAVSMVALVLGLTTNLLGAPAAYLGAAELLVLSAEFLVLFAWAVERTALERRMGLPELPRLGESGTRREFVMRPGRGPATGRGVLGSARADR